MPKFFRSSLMPISALLLLAAGCGGPDPTLPKTYPVTGKVVYKGGGQPMAGGLIEFKPLAAEPSLTMMSVIGADGTFSVTTRLLDGKQLPGAIEGKYQVLIVPPSKEDQSMEAIHQPQTQYAVEPRDNNFTIEIEKARQ